VKTGPRGGFAGTLYPIDVLRFVLGKEAGESRAGIPEA
jgi:hypothetical protein